MVARLGYYNTMLDPWILFYIFIDQVLLIFYQIDITGRIKIKNTSFIMKALS